MLKVPNIKHFLCVIFGTFVYFTYLCNIKLKVKFRKPAATGNSGRKIMNTLLEKIEEIVKGMPTAGNTKNIVAEREDYLFKAFKKERMNFVHAGEKPHGKVGKIVETKNTYRVFYRCGYGRYNYSPCFDIKKIRMKQTTYHLISTINSQVNGWTSFGCSNSKKDLEELADRLWLNRDEYGNLDIYDETYYKNYQIVSKTKANKVFHAI